MDVNSVGGLLNATCGNATEMIIALLALHQNKVHVKGVLLVRKERVKV